MNDAIRTALESPADYSQAFTSQVQQLAADLMTHTGLHARHDADMNYSSAQKLSYFFDASGRPVMPEAALAKLEVDVWLSSRGRLFACVRYARDEPGAWRFVAHDSWPSALDPVVEALEGHAYRRVDAAQGDELAEGHVTEMDGAPATVFQVLFSELA